MAIVLYHHPWSRAATVVWMLEEVGVDYELRFVDIRAGAHKTPELLALNPMGNPRRGMPAHARPGPAAPQVMPPPSSTSGGRQPPPPTSTASA